MKKKREVQCCQEADRARTTAIDQCMKFFHALVVSNSEYDYSDNDTLVFGHNTGQYSASEDVAKIPL